MLILLDVDDTISAFTHTIMHINNMQYNLQNPLYKTLISFEDILEDIEVSMGSESFKDAFYTQMPLLNLAEKLPVIPGAVQFVDTLREKHDVIFVTAPALDYPSWCNVRYKWLRSNFGCDKKDLIFTSQKFLINGDILIDDNVKYLTEWVETGRPAIKMLKPWNEKTKGIPAHSYDKAIEIINSLKV